MRQAIVRWVFEENSPCMLSISAFVTAGLFGESHSTSPPSAPNSSNKLSPLSLLTQLSVAALRSIIIGEG